MTPTFIEVGALHVNDAAGKSRIKFTIFGPDDLGAIECCVLDMKHTGLTQQHLLPLTNTKCESVPFQL